MRSWCHGSRGAMSGSTRHARLRSSMHVLRAQHGITLAQRLRGLAQVPGVRALAVDAAESGHRGRTAHPQVDRRYYAEAEPEELCAPTWS